jgi:hypothetical protein
MVVVRLPILRNQINFDVARTRLFLPKLHDRAAKVGAGLAIPKARVQHAHGISIDSSQFVPTKPLMAPDALQQAFRGLRGIALPQKRSRFLLRAPSRVKIRPGK